MASFSAPSDTELLTEHFGYPPVSLLDDIINSINILAERALNSVEQGLLNAPSATLGFRPPKSAASRNGGGNGDAQPQSVEELHKHEVENGTHQLETLLCASIDKNFDLFELYVMRNIICVRPEDRDWIRLSHYDGLDFAAAAREDAPTADGIGALRRKLRASQRLNAALHAEKAKNEALLANLHAMVGGGVGEKVKREDATASDSEAAARPSPPPLAFLQSRGPLADAGAEAPVSTTAAFTLSQLQALRALSASLRTMLPDLASSSASAAGGEPGGGGGSWRQERLGYVEASTRRYLENVRGLELGESGSVRDGEWQGEGRNLARGEVEGIERVVTLLGGNSEGGGRGDEMDES